MRVAVEDRLTPVKQQLRAAGLEVVSLHSGIPAQLDAVVVGSMDAQILGRLDMVAAVPVINAEGREAQEVAAEVIRRLAARHLRATGSAAGFGGRP